MKIKFGLLKKNAQSIASPPPLNMSTDTLKARYGVSGKTLLINLSPNSNSIVARVLCARAEAMRVWHFIRKCIANKCKCVAHISPQRRRCGVSVQGNLGNCCECIAHSRPHSCNVVSVCLGKSHPARCGPMAAGGQGNGMSAIRLP